MSVDIIFKIAAIGILVSVLITCLIGQAERKFNDGNIGDVGSSMVIDMISNLFNNIKVYFSLLRRVKYEHGSASNCRVRQLPLLLLLY